MARRNSQKVAKSKGPWSTNTCSVAPIDPFQVVKLFFFHVSSKDFFNKKSSGPDLDIDMMWGPFDHLLHWSWCSNRTTRHPTGLGQRQELWQLPCWSPVFTWPQTVWSMNFLVQILRSSVFSFVLDWEIYGMHASNHMSHKYVSVLAQITPRQNLTFPSFP